MTATMISTPKAGLNMTGMAAVYDATVAVADAVRLPITPVGLKDAKLLMATIRENMTVNANTRKTVKADCKMVMKWLPPDATSLRAQFQSLIDRGITDITIGFWRVSDAVQASEDAYGPESQIKSITAWSIANTDRGVDIWIHDIDSGQEESRVGLDLVREFVGTGLVKRVVGYKYDRIARSQYLSETLDREFGKKKCKWESATEDLPGGALGKLIKQILMAIAQFEAALIAQRMSGGKKIAIQKKGVWGGGEVPYGYLSKGQRGDTGKGVLVVCESEASVIELIFYLYGAGYSQTAIANFLNAQRIPTRNGGKLGWRQGQIRRILRHEAAYRAEALFSRQCFSPDTIAHAPIIPKRPADQRSYLLGNVTELPRGSQVPDGILGDALPMMGRANSVQHLTPEQGISLLRVFAVRDSGLSLAKTCAVANEQGLTSLEGRAWTPSNLQAYMTRRARYEALIADMGVSLAADSASTLAIDPEAVAAERETVERIKALRADGLSLQSIQHYLDAEGHRTMRGGRWHTSMIDRVIKGKTRRGAAFANAAQ